MAPPETLYNSKSGKMGEVCLALNEHAQTMLSEEHRSKAVRPAQTSAVVLSSWDVVMSGFNHSCRPSAKHVMYISENEKRMKISGGWRLAGAGWELSAIGVKIKKSNRGEFRCNGLWMPSQYLRRDSGSFPLSQKTQRQVSETRSLNEQPDARRTLHILNAKLARSQLIASFVQT